MTATSVSVKPERMKVMTLFHAETPSVRTGRGSEIAAVIAHIAASLPLRLSSFVSNRIARAVDHMRTARRLRREQAALQAMPFDLRKDLGWPAGDTGHRRRLP
ncbi:hypothetical protein ACSV9I_02770 [Rhizobium sp. G187]|uniref:hypothetical protein n=1 Tax=Rhizobium sp. G187 TaxID=3451352 RepID=UPI003EE5A8CF